jgi:hypothetical protein
MYNNSNIYNHDYGAARSEEGMKKKSLGSSYLVDCRSDI